MYFCGFCSVTKKIEFDEFHKDHFYNHVRRTIYYSLEMQHVINKYYYSAEARKVNQGVDQFMFYFGDFNACKNKKYIFLWIY